MKRTATRVGEIHACETHWQAYGGKTQIPPDLVVKFQPIDIVDVIL
jgi:hypothetical protein